MGICVGHIRLHVVDGRAIHEIGTLHPDDGTQLGIDLHARESHTREAQVIGTEGRTRGKDTQTTITSQTWGTNGESLIGFTVLRELPDEPKVIEILEATNGFGLAERGLEDDTTCQRFDKSALSGNTEFRRQRRLKMGYRMYFHGAKIQRNDKNQKKYAFSFCFSKIMSTFAE